MCWQSGFLLPAMKNTIFTELMEFANLSNLLSRQTDCKWNGGFFSVFWEIWSLCQKLWKGWKYLLYRTGPYSPAQFKAGAASTDGQRMLTMTSAGSIWHIVQSWAAMTSRCTCLTLSSGRQVWWRESMGQPAFLRPWYICKAVPNILDTHLTWALF